MGGGGHSLHKKDWVKIGGITAATLGTMGAAGLLGAGAAAAGSAGAVGADAAAAGAGAAGAGATDAAVAGSPALLGAGGGVSPGGGSLGAGVGSGVSGTLGSNVANGLANALGPSNFTAGLSGDAYMPGALGADGTGGAGIGNTAGGALRSPALGKTLSNAYKGAQVAGRMGLLGGQQQMPQGMRPQGGMAPTNTVLFPQSPGIAGGMHSMQNMQMLDPKDPLYWEKKLAQLQGGQ